MKVLSIYDSGLPMLSPPRGGIWTLLEPWKCALEIGKYIHSEKPSWVVYDVNAGFQTDLRSGSKAINLIAPKKGSHRAEISWIIHDLNFYEKLFSFNVSNDILCSMLETELSKWRIDLVRKGIELFGRDHFGVAETKWEKRNEKLFSVRIYEDKPEGLVLV